MFLSRFFFMRLGFFGGTFNPVHEGHLALAKEAFRTLHLDHLWWLPANPWQKDSRDLMPSEVRIKLLRLALTDCNRMSVDTRELDRKTLSYSIDTVRELAAEYPNDDRFYLIGSDQWNNFHTWKDWQKIFDYVSLVVFNRNGQLTHPAEEVESFIEDRKISVTMLPMPALDIDSSRIRQLIAQHDWFDPFLKTALPEKVFQFLCLNEKTKD